MRTRAPGASTKTQLPPLPLDKTQRRTLTPLLCLRLPAPARRRRSRLLRGACSRTDRTPTRAGAVLGRRDAAFEKERQAPQQGEAEGAEAQALAPQEEPAEGDARQVAARSQRPVCPNPPPPRAV